MTNIEWDPARTEEISSPPRAVEVVTTCTTLSAPSRFPHGAALGGDVAVLDAVRIARGRVVGPAGGGLVDVRAIAGCGDGGAAGRQRDRDSQDDVPTMRPGRLELCQDPSRQVPAGAEKVPVCRDFNDSSSVFVTVRDDLLSLVR